VKLKLSIAYDGTPFAGWQSQAGGDAVQDVLERALQKIAGARIVLHGSGRTDAGVHALGQCAHFECGNSLSPADWQRALNANLPPTVRILQAEEAADDFHARFDARGKIYRYVIRNAAVLPPHEVDRVWHMPHELNPETLQEAAKIFEGRHNFSAFSANRGGAVRDAHRTVREVLVSQEGTLLTLVFEGEGFLYKMVRMMVGAAVRSAQGRESVEVLRQRLDQTGPRWNHVAPAGGLYLVKVLY
jgi:tRNA pseudouridine38-40 synthase